MNFKGKVALITGAGSNRGIGREVGRQLLSRGCQVILTDVNETGLVQIVNDFKTEYDQLVSFSKLDVSNRKEVSELVGHILGKYGKIDILINSAGITYPTRILDISEEEWNRIFEVNMKGIYNTTQEVLPAMIDKSYGRIVNLSSIAGKRGGGSFGGSHYAASKAAVAGFTKAIAREMAQHNITCNCVAPGVIDTDITGDLLTEELEEKRMQGIPMNRKGTTAEVASLIAYLASDLSSYITGEEVDVNGGLHID